MAFEMFDMMKTLRLSPNDVTYNSMIDVCVRCGDTEQAWKLLSDMQLNHIHPDNFTYSTLIKGIRAQYSHQYIGGVNNPKDLEKAFYLLDTMKKSNHVQPDEILYNCIIDACVRFH